MTFQTRINAPRSSSAVLIAGGAGFIGSHLCDALLQHGNRVICVDNLFTGTTDNIRPLLNHPNFRFIEHDVRDPFDVDEDVSRIYSLACPASPRHYQKDPIGTMKTCVMGTLNILELALKKGLACSRHPPARSMAIPKFIPSPSPISATSIRSARALAMTRANGPQRP